MMHPLSPIQENIVNTDGNIIVRASAGAGKTHTMVTKIESDIDKNTSHKVIAAITFTIKAAKEIRDRLLITSDDHFVGTNNSFAIEEVIKPFMRDVYGNDYKIDMSTDYGLKVDTYDDALDLLRTKGVLCTLRNNKENLIFQLALYVVKNSYACREYLKSKYFKIFVDEYQDCDRDMHAFFMYLCDELNIEFFVVGDEKQSIYMWRGAYPEAFKSIWNKENFSKKFMGENFRSCISIQNYSNVLCEETRGFIKPIDDVSAIKLVITDSLHWHEKVLPEIDKNQTAAVLRYKKDKARMAANLLSTSDNPFVFIPHPPICDITTNTAWLIFAIAEFFIVDTYSVYDFMQIIPEEAVGDRKLKGYLEKSLDYLKNDLDNDDVKEFTNHTRILADYFGYNTREDHANQLYETIKDDMYHNFFMQDKIQNVALTFHSSKGLEFEQVIIFAEDYKLDDKASIYNHYVAATRAKSKLIIVYLCGYDDKCFSNNLNQIINAADIKYSDLFTVVK